MERARFAFDIYDFEGKARMDLFYLGDVLRGLNLNPTLKMIEKLGGTKKKGEKFLKLEEVGNLLVHVILINYFFFKKKALRNGSHLNSRNTLKIYPEYLFAHSLKKWTVIKQFFVWFHDIKPSKFKIIQKSIFQHPKTYLKITDFCECFLFYGWLTTPYV